MKDMTPAEMAAQAAALKKLNRLNLAELRALGDRHARLCPHPIHLANALARLRA